MFENIFDWTKEIMTRKRSWSSFSEEEKKIFNPFMIHKILSMNYNYIGIVNYIQKIPHNEKEKIYRVYCDMIPKKFIFSPFIKAKKDKKEIEHLFRIYEEWAINNHYALTSISRFKPEMEKELNYYNLQINESNR